jgi:methionine-S-sulfoxide reductase
MRVLVILTALSLACTQSTPPAPAPAVAPVAYVAPAGQEIAILAGGCFWGMEDILRKVPGVVDTIVGYTHGAESVKITFDPSKISYETLLDRWYFRMHDPTTKNQQGNDIGPAYRSAIFYTSEAQRQVAEAVKSRVGASGRWKNPIVTEITPAGAFQVAEADHQDYLERNPGGYTCHYLRDE